MSSSVSWLIAPSEGQQPAGRLPKAAVKTRMPSRMCQAARSAPPGYAPVRGSGVVGTASRAA